MEQETGEHPSKPEGSATAARQLAAAASSARPSRKRLMWQVARFLLACGVAFGLENAALSQIGRDEPTSALAQHVFGLRDLYTRIVSSWPRELVPRYTTVVHIDPDRDPTARGLAHNLCLQREYLATLLPLIAAQRPAVLVVDKYFTAAGCPQEGPTQALRAAVARSAQQAPVVVGVLIDERAVGREPPQLPLLRSPLEFAQTEGLSFAIVNRDAEPRRIPLGWIVSIAEDKPGKWMDGIALAAAVVKQPKLVERSSRLRGLKERLDNPYTSMIPAADFEVVQAADILCTDAQTREQYWNSCLGRSPAAAGVAGLRGQVVVLGELNPLLDHHETTIIGKVPGTILQANYVEALLDGRYFVPVWWPINLAAGLLFFIAVEVALSVRSRWRALLALGGVLIAMMCILSLVARYAGHYVDPAVSLVALVLSLIAWFKERITEAGEKSYGR